MSPRYSPQRHGDLDVRIIVCPRLPARRGGADSVEQTVHRAFCQGRRGSRDSARSFDQGRALGSSGKVSGFSHALGRSRSRNISNFPHAWRSRLRCKSTASLYASTYRLVSATRGARLLLRDVNRSIDQPPNRVLLKHGKNSWCAKMIARA